MGKLRRLVGLAVVIALATTACGDDEESVDDGGDATTAPPGTDRSTSTSGPPTTGAPPTTGSSTTAGEASTIDLSPLSAALTEAYGDGPPAVAPGDVTVHWYQADGVYVALYTGEGIGGLPSLCPGNSLAVPSGEYENVSNAPTGDGGCDGVDSTITEVTVCDAAWIMPTAIPADAEGQLFASISSPDSSAGVLGFVPTGPEEIPEIDLAASSFTVSAGILGGGATELACS
jgi:hypothetical protein